MMTMLLYGQLTVNRLTGAQFSFRPAILCMTEIPNCFCSMRDERESIPTTAQFFNQPLSEIMHDRKDSKHGLFVRLQTISVTL